MKTLILTFLLASLSLASFAGEYSEKRQDRMIKQLDLNAQQSEKLQSIFDSKSDQRKALQQQIFTLREQTNSEIEAILTPEQLQKYQKIKNKRQKKMGEQRKGKDKNKRS